jgi:hypothetical protein
MFYKSTVELNKSSSCDTLRPEEIEIFREISDDFE